MPNGAAFDEMGIMVTDDGRLVVHGHTTYALRLVSSVRLEKDPAQPDWLPAMVAVLGFGSGRTPPGAGEVSAGCGASFHCAGVPGGN